MAEKRDGLAFLGRIEWLQGQSEFFFLGSPDDFTVLENKIQHLGIFINLAAYFPQVCENSFLENKI